MSAEKKRANLLTALNKWRVDTQSGEFDLITIQSPITKYNVDRQQFWELYNAYYVASQLETYPMSCYLLESPRTEYSYLRFDIDFYPPKNQPPNHNVRLYTTRDILDAIKHINFLIDDLAGKECEQHIQSANNYICCVFEKDSWKAKDGVHIAYPNLFIRNEFQNSYFVSKLQIHFNKVANREISVDKVAMKPWVLLGSHKTQTDVRYQLRNAFNHALEPISIEPYNLPSVFSINNYSAIVYGKSRQLPVIMKRTRLMTDIEKDLKQIRDWNIMSYLSIDRCYAYDKWIEIGLTLYNIGCGDERFLHLWKEFSQRCPDKYDEKACEVKWATFETRNLTLGSLIYHFKADSPGQFNRHVNSRNLDDMYNRMFCFDINNEAIRPAMIKTLTSTFHIEHRDIADIMFNKYNTDIVWSKLSNKRGDGMWYQFTGVRWMAVPEEFIDNLIYDKIAPYMASIMEDMEPEAQQQGATEIDTYMMKKKTMIDNKLRNGGFISGCLQAARPKFLRQNFKLDSNKFLIGCENGVLDLERKVFRSASPDDYIGMSTGITYVENPSKSDIDELHEYFSELFTDGDLRTNVIELLANMLVGSNDDKNVFIALGKANTGKSQLVLFLTQALGDYILTFPTDLVYQRSGASNSSGCRPELTRATGKRIGCVNELSKRQHMNVSTIKELSGNDRFYARDLFKGGQEHTPMFTLYMTCNDVPKIPEDDEAMWSRILIIPFSSQYSHAAPKDRAAQYATRTFPRVANLDAKFKRLAPTFLWMLFNRYKMNSLTYDKGIPICDAIKTATRRHREEHNPVYKFFEDRISIDRELGGFIPCTKMFDYFSLWYKSFFPDQRLRMNKDAFKEAFDSTSKIPRTKEKPEGALKKIEGWPFLIYGEKGDPAEVD